MKNFRAISAGSDEKRFMFKKMLVARKNAQIFRLARRIINNFTFKRSYQGWKIDAKNERNATILCTKK